LRDVDLRLTPVTLLIGPNGAGKSNVLWALEMVRMLAFDSLQLFVSERGGATFLMHYGPKETAAIDISLEFVTDGGENAYEARLAYGADESLLFVVERAGHRKIGASSWTWTDLGVGHRESQLHARSWEDRTAKVVLWLLRRINFYHFHDTSLRAPLRTRNFADTSATYLRSDGSNLAVFLAGLRDSDKPEDRASFERIVSHVQSVAPFIRALNPVEDRRGVTLEWTDDRGYPFGPAHLSDGTLRAIALLTALEQPLADRPIVSCIDEPELGFHPAAIDLFGGVVRSVAVDRQVVLSTQSLKVLDQFDASSVVVAERQAGETILRRPDPSQLASWLSEFRLSEVYESNLLGGRP
jgi:predicted ATPase